MLQTKEPWVIVWDQQRLGGSRLLSKVNSLIIVLFLGMAISPGFSQEPKVFPLEVIKRINLNSQQSGSNLKVSFDANVMGPFPVGFYPNGDILLVDNEIAKIFVIGNKDNKIRLLGERRSNSIMVVGLADASYVTFSSNSCEYFDGKGNLINFIYLKNNVHIDCDMFLIVNKHLFLQEKKEQMYMVPNFFSGEKELLDPKKARDFLGSNHELQIDSNGFLRSNGIVISADFATFRTNRLNFPQSKKNEELERISDQMEKSKVVIYLGSDQENNRIWFFDTEETTIVVNKLGYTISVLKTPIHHNGPGLWFYPLLHPTGDLFFLDFDKNKNELLFKRIKKVW